MSSSSIQCNCHFVGSDPETGEKWTECDKCGPGVLEGSTDTLTKLMLQDGFTLDQVNSKHEQHSNIHWLFDEEATEFLECDEFEPGAYFRAFSAANTGECHYCGMHNYECDGETVACCACEPIFRAVKAG